MNKVIHRSSSRGLAEHGWLHSRLTFNTCGKIVTQDKQNLDPIPPAQQVET